MENTVKIIGNPNLRNKKSPIARNSSSNPYNTGFSFLEREKF